MKLLILIFLLFFTITPIVKAQNKTQIQIDSINTYLNDLTFNDSCLTRKFGKYESQETRLDEWLNAGIIILKDEAKEIAVNEKNIAHIEWMDKNEEKVNSYYVTITNMFNETLDIVETDTSTAIIDFSLYYQRSTPFMIQIISSYCRSSDFFIINNK